MSIENDFKKHTALLIITLYILVFALALVVAFQSGKENPHSDMEPYNCVVLSKTFYHSSDDDFSYKAVVLDTETNKTIEIEINLIEFNSYDLNDRIIVWAYETDWGE